MKPTLRWFTEAWTVSVVELRDGSPNVPSFDMP